MTCQRCRDEATIHLTETIDGRRRELHLCAACARKAGLELPEAKPNLALDQVVQTLIVAHVGELVGTLAQLACPYCGLKFMEFRAAGRLGCPHDYQVFGRGLLPLLQRAHESTRHVGKIPNRRPERESASRLRLRAKLREAVARENYE
jgi:protein arginine kinase activator